MPLGSDPEQVCEQFPDLPQSDRPHVGAGRFDDAVDADCGHQVRLSNPEAFDIDLDGVLGYAPVAVRKRAATTLGDGLVSTSPATTTVGTVSLPLLHDRTKAAAFASS